jgi:uncharacterized protein
MPEDIIGRGWEFPLKVDTQGGIALTGERNEIEQAILIILGTQIGTRVMRPTFGSRLYELIFMPNNLHTAALAQRYVEEALGMWEPRIQVIDVITEPHNEQDNCLVIEIQYEVKTLHDRRSLVYPFYLIPEEG